MTQILLQANVQLAEVQEQVQEVDQWMGEIMGLISQQWASSFRESRGTLLNSARSSSKVEIFMDPRMYNNSKVKFKDW